MFRLLSRVLFAALCAAVICIPAAAQNATAQTGKMVWINMEQAILSCDEGKNEFAEIQKYVDGKTADLDAMRKEFESLKNQLSVQGSKLTDEARADLQYQITTKETQIQRFQQDTQNEINRKRDNVTNYIVKRLQHIIDTVAREKGLAAVMVLDPNRDAWIDPTLDITEEMVKAYNTEHPVTAAKKEPLAP
jgi:Skp family chaperone for outer membrane proteins